MSLDTRPEYLTAAEQTESIIKNNVVNLANHIEQVYHNVLTLGVFENKYGLTAQQAADSLGTDAETLFSFLGACKNAVENHTSRTFTPVSTYGSVSNDGDGTVTITVN